MSSYINHITLETGHLQQSPRSEVAQPVIDVLIPHIQRAVKNGSDPFPYQMNGETPQLKATATGPFLLATVMSQSGAPIATFGVAPRSRGAANLWSILHDGRPTGTHRADIPSAPWLAARIETRNILQMMAASLWLADYERCVAWAWIEGGKSQG